MAEYQVGIIINGVGPNGNEPTSDPIDCCHSQTRRQTGMSSYLIPYWSDGK
jgi:hypothetical protein